MRDGERTPGKVAIFSTCYVNYNEPGIGHDLLKILEHNEIPYVLVEKEACCGMPKLELGDLDAVAKLKDINIPPLAALARDGYAILTPVPSCTLMFKQELPLMFPGRRGRAGGARRDVRPVRVPRAARQGRPAARRDFKPAARQGRYHIPCHSRVQNIGQKTREVLEMVPGTEVNTVERCSGHDGTWGVKTEFFANVDEDRPPGVPRRWPDGPSPTTSAPTARSPAATSSRACAGRSGPRARRKAASAHAAAMRLRARLNADERPWPTSTRDSLHDARGLRQGAHEFRAQVIAHKKSAHRAPRAST